MSRKLILHVENDPNDVFLVQRAFREATISAPVRVVEDGKQAVEYLRGEGDYSDRRKNPLPDLIFLDLNMPRLSGHELLEWLKSQPLLRRIPVVIMTSSKHLSDINLCYERGANSYLVKPVSYRDLVDQVKAFKEYWLGRSELPDMRHASFS